MRAGLRGESAVPTQQPGGGRHLAASEPVVEALDEREWLGVQAWPGGSKEQFIRIIPTHITGRRIRRATDPA